MRNRTIELVQRLRPADADRVAEIFPAARRSALLEQILRERHAAPAAPSAPSPARHARVRLLSRATVLALTASGVLAIAFAVALLASGSSVGPERAAAAVRFRSTPRGDIVATVRNPFAAKAQLDAAFAAHGFAISVHLLPVSPSLVGTVVEMSGGGDGNDAITPIQGGHCVTGGGGCAIGIKIGRGFTGHADVTLGRPARAGEGYESSTSAFAPGESLHCSGVLGARVRDALGVLRARGLVVTQWREDVGARERTDQTPPLADYVWSAIPMAPGRLYVWTRPAPWPGDAAHGAVFDAGC